MQLEQSQGLRALFAFMLHLNEQIREHLQGEIIYNEALVCMEEEMVFCICETLTGSSCTCIYR